MPEVNVFEVIKKETGGYRGKPAVIDGDSVYSYAELISLVESVADVLGKGGVGRFHRVGLVCNNSVDYITVSLAILSLGAAVVPVSPDHTQDEIDEIFRSICVDFAIHQDGAYKSEDADAIAFEGLNYDFYMGKGRHGIEPPAGYSKINPAFIRFSSGTTGKSKGVVLSHQTIIDRTSEVDKALKIAPEDGILWVLSMSFHFVVTILLFLRRAATIIICNNPFVESLSSALSKHGGTIIYASPFHYNVICNSEQIPPDSLKNIRLAISTTSKLPMQMADEFKKKYGFSLVEAYGIIEVGLPFINLYDANIKPDSVGKALPGYQIRISEEGEILIKGKGMFDAYFSPWQEREEILDEGWFKTGDLGLLDDDQNLKIIGRNKNVIDFTGMKIFPYEVESVINKHSMIQESYVYGEEHPMYGQLPVARIVVKKGFEDMLDLDELRGFCYKRLSQYKVPKQFVVVDEIPKTVSGKIKRH